MKMMELVAVIAGIKTALPVSMDLVSTDGKMRKTGNPYPNALKHVTISGMIGCSYENAVNNQLGREDKGLDFEAQKPSWMKTSGMPNLGANADGSKFYLPIKVQSSGKPRYMNNGVDVTDIVKPFIAKSESPKTQDALENKVIWRTPAVESIACIRMLGAEYTIQG